MFVYHINHFYTPFVQPWFEQIHTIHNTQHTCVRRNCIIYIHITIVYLKFDVFIKICTYACSSLFGFLERIRDQWKIQYTQSIHKDWIKKKQPHRRNSISKENENVNSLLLRFEQQQNKLFCRFLIIHSPNKHSVINWHLHTYK